MAIEATDEQLLRDYAVSGSPEVFAVLYRRFAVRLEGPVRRMVCCGDDVGDVIQETFLAVHLKARTFDGRSAVYSWVFAIARNVAATIGRRSKSRREQPIPDIRDLAIFRDRQPPPETQIIAAQDLDTMLSAINQLSDPLAETVRLVDMADVDYVAAAKQLGIPVGTVRSRRHRALINLRKAMAACLLIICGVTSAADPITPTAAHRVNVESIHDGDTVHGSIDMGYGLTMTMPGGIRAFGYDCWELGRQRQQVIGKITDAEIAKGIAARDDLIELLKTCDLYAEDSGEIDPHGRGSAILWAKAKESGKWILLAKWMEQRGHLRVSRDLPTK